MSIDPEFDLLRQGWKSAEPSDRKDIHALRAEAVRQEMRQRKRLVLEFAIGGFFLVFSFLVAWIDRSPEIILWAAAVWILTFIVSAYMAWNYQTLWKDSVKSVQDFTTLSRNRATATLRAVDFGYLFIGLSVFIDVVWYSIDLGLNRIDFPKYCLGLGLIALISAAIAVMLRRRRVEAIRDLEQIGPPPAQH